MKKRLKIADLTEVDSMSFIRIDIPDNDPILKGNVGSIYIRYDPETTELNVEVADLREPLKSKMQIKSFSGGEIVLKMGG